MGEHKHKLLVVDDEVEICDFVRMFFEQRGFLVVAAHDGEEGLKTAAKEKPSIILLDVKMKSEHDGFDALPKLRKLLPDAAIIMVTGVEDEESREKGRALGAEDYITKPLILEKLEETVYRKVGR